jgi:hypothetical protein
MSIDIDKVRQLIAETRPDVPYSCSDCCPSARGRTSLARLMPAALDRIEQLQAALVEYVGALEEACDDATSRERFNDLRALAAGKVTPAADIADGGAR